MRNLSNKLNSSGKNTTKVESRRYKSFGYQVLGFGAGGGKSFIEASGGTVTEDGNFKIHTFTGTGSFVVSKAPGDGVVDYIVLAGGGAGAVNGGALPTPVGSCGVGGAGGAGGYRESPGVDTGYTASPLGASPAVALPVTAQSYPVTVGGGGAGVSGNNTAGNAGSAGSPPPLVTFITTQSGDPLITQGSDNLIT